MTTLRARAQRAIAPIDAEITGLTDAESRVRAVLRAIIERRKAAESRRSDIVAAEHRHACQLRRQLWTVSNFRWRAGKGPRYGDGVRFVRHERGSALVTWRGEYFRLPYNSLALVRPSGEQTQLNRTFGRIMTDVLATPPR